MEGDGEGRRYRLGYCLKGERVIHALDDYEGDRYPFDVALLSSPSPATIPGPL